MSREATLARFREYMVGPTRFMNLLSCFELGIIDALRDTPGLTAAQLGEAVGAKPDAVEQLLQLLVKEDFVAYDDDTAGYSLDALAELDDEEVDRLLAFMDLIKVCSLRQLFYLTETVRTGKIVGLKEFYDFDGNLFEAVGVHKDLRKSWAKAMDLETLRIDPWFFENIDIPADAKVLDLAGNTGIGAVDLYKYKGLSDLHVTTFDLPQKEEACLKNFQKHSVAEHCSFIGGDVFTEVPKGFDIVLIKHFLALWDDEHQLAIFRQVNKALEIGKEIYLLVPLYPEANDDDTDPRSVEFYPAFFQGTAMAQGGGHKVSSLRNWLKECGFEVTKVVRGNPEEVQGDALPIHAVVAAKKIENLDD